jgi:DegV family protein with EDD domain
MIDNLENLYKGGRISQVTAVLGTALQIKPLLSVQEGHVSVWSRVRTRSRAVKELVARVHSWGPLEEMAVMHTGAVELAQNLVDTLHGLVPEERLVIGPAGPALATHLGLGAVGVLALQAAEE